MSQTMAIRNLTIQELRDTFLGFFGERGHITRPSAPLVLHDDPTSLFTSAGMQPYIGAFRGEDRPPAPRVASCQKCLRTGDIDDVGRYNRYHTSSRCWATSRLATISRRKPSSGAGSSLPASWGYPARLLWVTVFETDDEAEELWRKHIGVPADRIQRWDRNDNWWPKVRWEGPCGPCTEIHVDLGPSAGCPNGCEFGCNCNRWLELWNLVFQQYTEAEDGALTPLPAPGIDTGMGLERLGLVSQGKEWSMETDELWHVLTTAQEIINEDRDKPYVYGQDAELDLALRVIADHIRGVAFVIADNVTPSNEGAGYVIRRLIRRAYRFGRKLGAQKPFLYRALPAVTQAMGQVYPELAQRQDYAVKVLQGEEERFDATLEHGLALFEEIVEDLGRRNDTCIPGDLAFRLSDTYGFPVEVTRELAGERGLTVDEEGFQQALQAQRERARGKAKGLELAVDLSISSAAGTSEFTGHDRSEDRGTVTLVIADGQIVESVDAGAEAGIVLERTPFYAERGGQVGDTGVLEAGGAKFEVRDTVPLGDAVMHVGTVVSGKFAAGDAVVARVDAARRGDIRRNHSATHLLQAALREVLGDHVAQSGSMVAPDRLRFDFSHHEAVSPEQLERVEDLVNGWIMEDFEIASCEMGLDEARQAGAIALFGEKYEDTVRAVSVSGVSMELCGGTHCRSTGEIGLMRIVHESSVAAGVRRIEAVTGRGALKRFRQAEADLGSAAAALNCQPHEVVERIDGLRKRISELQHEVKAAREMSAATNLDDIIASAQAIGDAQLVTASIPGADHDALAALADKITDRLTNGVAVLGSVDDGKVNLICKVDKGVIDRGGHAGDLIREVAQVCGGGGGGRPNFAKAGGKDADKLDAALAKASEALAAQLG